MRADALFRQGKLNEACSLFQQSLDTDSRNPPTYWGLAQCAVAQHDTAKARQWLDAALKLKDKQAKSWIYVGDLEQLNGQAPAALAPLIQFSESPVASLNQMTLAVERFGALGSTAVT